MPSFKPQWKGLLKCLGPLFFIFLVVQVVDPATTAGLLKDIKPGWAAISMLLFPILLAVLTLRWWLICQRLEMQIPFKTLFQINYIAWFLGLIPLMAVTPLSKFIYLKDRGIPAGKTALSITLDKIFDVIGLVLFSFFGLIYFPRGFFQEIHLWIFLTAGLLALAAILVFWNTLWAAFIRFLKKVTGKKLKRIGEKLDVDLSAFASQFDFSFLVFMILIAVGLGILRAFILYLLAVSLNIYVGFGLMVACRALIGIVNIVPITVNGLGTRDAVLLLALPLANVSKEATIALSCLMFLWLVVAKFSGIFFWLKYPLPAKILSAKQRGRRNIDTAS